MENRYIDLIEKTFEWPQFDLELNDDELTVFNLNVNELVERFGSPLKVFYLPKIREQIQKSIDIFKEAGEKLDYKGKYTYCYCTKSSHFSFVLDQVLREKAHLETSSAYDMHLIDALFRKGKLTKDTYILCNGFKEEEYLNSISNFLNRGFNNVIPILDHIEEVNHYNEHVEEPFELGLRIAAEEEPNFGFYTSRLGIRYRDLVPLYLEKIKSNPKAKLKMLHFFINTGIRDSSYYWNELNKCINAYCDLKMVCDSLDSLDIGGGFPVANSLNFDYDYAYMVEEILRVIQERCEERGVEVPHVFTEFGSFTVAESAFNVFSVLGEKIQNDTEKWYMVNGSFITTMPDIWAIDQRYILLAGNNWKGKYERVNLGGQSCDSMDYYSSEAHINQVFLPEIPNNRPLNLVFLNTGAYQESLSGYGGVKHCLIPSPTILLVDEDEKGERKLSVFSKKQGYKSMLKNLGY